jgi:predicted Zn-dependent protease
MHHHLRGLLLQARGQHRQAAAAFRRAIWSPSQGYSRTNLELARELLSIDKADEAVTVLEPALRGPLNSMGTYATQTDIRALLAEALDRAGDRSGALAQMAWVETAWADAEPPVRARLDSLRDVLRVSTEQR